MVKHSWIIRLGYGERQCNVCKTVRKIVPDPNNVKYSKCVYFHNGILLNERPDCVNGQQQIQF